MNTFSASVPPRRGRVFRATFHSLGEVIEQARGYRGVVAFDVFDTLLRRRVEPEWVKDRFAQIVSGRILHGAVEASCLRQLRRELEQWLVARDRAAGGDGEYTLCALLTSLLRRINVPCTPRCIESLRRCELDLECLATYPTPGIVNVLSRLTDAGVRLLFISDMYLGAEGIYELLAHHKLARFFDRGFCSCDVGLSKHSGRLFRHVLAELGIGADQMLFVGDNPDADVRPARRIGIDVVHVRDPSESVRRRRLMVLACLAQQRPFWQGRHACEVVEQDDDLSDAAAPETRIALILAPALTAFALDLVQQACHRGLDQFAFVSREGPTLLRIYRRITRRLAPSAPPAVFLPVSRRSTFLPSLERFDAQSLESLWRRYPRQSLRSLLSNCGLPSQPFVALAAEHGLTDAESVLEGGPDDARLTAWLADPRTQRSFRWHRDRARALLLDHLRQRGLLGATQRLGIVDIGWHGSIQDNLARLLNPLPYAPELHGLYLGLLREQPDERRYGFLADIRRSDWSDWVLFANGPIIEMFTSVSCGAIVGYTRPLRRGGLVRPRLEADPYAEAIRPIASAVRRAMFTWVDRFIEHRLLIPADAAALRLVALDRLRRFLLYPSRSEAIWFLSLTHNESFGQFGATGWRPPTPWSALLWSGPLTTLPKRVIQNLERTFWPQRYLRVLGLPLLNLAWDLLETYYHGRGKSPNRHEGP